MGVLSPAGALLRAGHASHPDGARGAEHGDRLRRAAALNTRSRAPTSSASASKAGTTGANMRELFGDDMASPARGSANRLMTDRQDSHWDVAGPASGALPSLRPDGPLWVTVRSRPHLRARPRPHQPHVVYLRPDTVGTVLPYPGRRRSGLILAGAKPSEGIRALEEVGGDVPTLIGLLLDVHRRRAAVHRPA